MIIQNIDKQSKEKNSIKTYKELKDSKYYAIDFYLSKSCNKSCHYCTAWTLEMRNLDVNMDFLRRTLEYISPFPARINLLGGEPALIKNLDEVIAEIKKHDNLICAVLSNSLIRKKYPHVLEDPEIFYFEHLVLDFHKDKIEKLGNFDFFSENENNNYNIIIETPNYFEYKKNFDLEYINHKNSIFKAYNSRSPTYDIKFQSPELNRRVCAAFPSVPVVDFEIEKIRHCSKKVINGSRQFDVTKENVYRMMTYDLFEFEDYCRTCTEAIPDWSRERILIMYENNARALS